MIIVDSLPSYIEPALRECFATDEGLLSRWHIEAPGSLDACVGRTMRDVQTTFDPETFKFYRVFEGDELAGYWGTEFQNYINLIFVKPKFRRADFMSIFWEAVLDSLKTPFFTAVYAKNSPAISFYSSRRGQPSKKEVAGHPVMMFEFHKEYVCQYQHQH